MSVKSALNLSDGQTGEDFGMRVWTDEDEWFVRQSQFENRREKAHGNDCIIVGLEAYFVVIAPCSADLLAKIAGGICDSLATCLLRALGPSTPVIMCPAMNTHMYQHRLTARHLTVVQEDLRVPRQGGGRLACGDDGKYLMVNDMHSSV
ncbi:hypothetical protein I310_01878 [Cryptococcus deuterogattii CA1014]|nr:hypothetical protein I310_01878 [Cryptococcus deuterogattii CA1014]